MINPIYQILQNKLKNELFAQDQAIEEVISSFTQNEMFQKRTKIKAFFTFLGVANSGKHYMCELLNKYHDEISGIKTFYMDQYSNSGMVGYEDFNATTFIADVVNFVLENPNSILVFEDIEKAELQIQLALCTLLSDYEKEMIDLSEVVIVVTTTQLSDQLNKTSIQRLRSSSPLQLHTYIIEKLSTLKINVGNDYDDAFDRKLLSYMNEHSIILFNSLNLQALFKIASEVTKSINQSLEKNSDITVSYKEFDKVISLMTLSLSPYLNARYIKQKLPNILFDSIYNELIKYQNVKQIQISSTKISRDFLEDVISNEEEFISKINRQNQRVQLKWQIKFENEILKCSLKKAYFEKVKLQTTSNSMLLVSSVNFDNVAGHKKVKKELKEIIGILKNPKRLKQFNLDIPKGMILTGPKGMGKKLFSQAIAAELNYSYIKVSGSQLFDTKYIQSVYDNARSHTPVVVIFEDIDTQGVMNGVVASMSLEPIINQLDMINNTPDSIVFTILTTSDASAIVSDLLNANRIDIQVQVPKLDMEAREYFMNQILQKPCEDSIDIKRLVKYISGMGGDELKRIGQEASLYAARKGLKKLTQEILLEQINIIKYGVKLENKQIRDIELSMSKTAYHEAGHAVLSYVLLPKIKIEQVTVAPRSEALGFVSYHNEEYIDATNKKDIFNDICVLLAGRIAKMYKYGDDGMETGAVNDLEVATAQAYAAIALFGMDDELGYINVTSIQSGLGEPIFKEKIEQRVLFWIQEAKKKTESEVKRLWRAIDAVAKALIDKEVIDGDELSKIIQKNI